LDLEHTRIIKDAPGVMRGSDGPIASAELFVIVDVPKRATGTDANVPLRGVEPAAFAVRKAVKIVEGRPFREGQNEVIAGRAAAREFAGLEVGNHLRWGDNVWEVVGLFSAGDSVYESEIWTDARVAQPAYRRTGFQSVYAWLESPDAFQRFKDALTSDPRLDVEVKREDEYYEAQSQVLRTLVRTLGNVVALLMAVGATFGALNTMYSAVAARGREIATLRALGFQAGPVLVSVMAESLLLALLGGSIGGGVARCHSLSSPRSRWSCAPRSCRFRSSVTRDRTPTWRSTGWRASSPTTGWSATTSRTAVGSRSDHTVRSSGGACRISGRRNGRSGSRRRAHLRAGEAPSRAPGGGWPRSSGSASAAISARITSSCSFRRRRCFQPPGSRCSAASSRDADPKPSRLF